MLLWLIPTIVAVWAAVALVVVSLCAAAARADGHLPPEREVDERRFLRAI